MTTTTVEAFSISAAAVLTPTGPTGASLYAVQSGAITLELDDYALSSDDWVQGYWSNIRDVTVQVTSGFLNFSALSYISGTQVLSSQGAPDNYYAAPLWSQYQANSPPVTLALRLPAKDSTGATGTVDIILYQVFLYGVEPGGAAYKEGVTASFTGKAVLSQFDDQGNHLADKAFGRVLAWVNAHSSFTSPIGTVYQIRSADSAASSDAAPPRFSVHLASSDTARAGAETDSLTTTAVATSQELPTSTEAARIGPSDSDFAQASDFQQRFTYAAPTAPLTGKAALQATGHQAISGSFASPGYGQLTATAMTTPPGQAQIPGHAALSGTGGPIKTITRSPGSAAISGSAPNIQVASSVRVSVSTTLTGTGLLGAASPTGGSLTLGSDISTPAPSLVTAGTSGFATSNVFAPPAGSLVVVPVTWMYYGTGPISDQLACSDSSGQSYTESAADPASRNVLSAAIFTWYYPTAPGSISVTVTSNAGPGFTADALVSPRVLTGAASLQASAAKLAASSGSIALTTTQDQSWVFYATGNNTNGSGGAISGTFTIAFWGDQASGDDAAAGWVVTGLHGPQAAAGFSSMVRGVALEVLHG